MNNGNIALELPPLGRSVNLARPQNEVLRGKRGRVILRVSSCGWSRKRTDRCHGTQETYA